MNAPCGESRFLPILPPSRAVIEKESGDAAHLLRSYVALLALVPAVFGLIGACVVGTVCRASVWCGRRSRTVCSALFSAMSSLVPPLLPRRRDPSAGADVRRQRDFNVRSSSPFIRIRRCGSPVFFCWRPDLGSSDLPGSTVSIFCGWACRR